MEKLILFRFKIAGGDTEAFEKWQQEVSRETDNFPGFIESVNLKPTQKNDYYYVILRFKDEISAQNWLQSDRRKELISTADVKFMEDREMTERHWDNFWFPTQNRLKKWKQLIMTFLAVYPIAQFFPFLYRVLLPKWGIDFGDIVNGILIGLSISAMMNYVLMPLIMKYFSKWMAK